MTSSSSAPEGNDHPSTMDTPITPATAATVPSEQHTFTPQTPMPEMTPLTPSTASTRQQQQYNDVYNKASSKSELKASDILSVSGQHAENNTSNTSSSSRSRSASVSSTSSSYDANNKSPHHIRHSILSAHHAASANRYLNTSSHNAAVPVHRTAFPGPPLSQKYLRMMSASGAAQNHIHGTQQHANVNNAVISLNGASSLAMMGNSSSSSSGITGTGGAVGVATPFTSSSSSSQKAIGATLQDLIPRLKKHLQSHIVHPLYVHISCQSVCVYDVETLQQLQTLSLPLKNFISCRFMKPKAVIDNSRKDFLYLCTLEESLVKKKQPTSLTIFDVKTGMIHGHQKLQYIKGKYVAHVSIWQNNYILIASTRGEMELWHFSHDSENNHKRMRSELKTPWNLELCWYWNFSKEVDVLNSFSISPFKNDQMVLTCTDGMYFVKDLNPTKHPQSLVKQFKVSQTKAYDFVWSPNEETQLFLVTAKDISLYDTDLRKTVDGRSIRSNAVRSDFTALYFDEEDSTTLFTSHLDGTVCAWTWSAEKNKYVSSFCDIIRGSKHGMDRPNSLVSVAICPSTRSVVGYDIDGTLWFWRYLSHRKKFKWMLQGYHESISSQVSSLQVSPFENLLAIGTTSGELYIYNLEDNSLRFKYSLFDGIIQNVTWSSRNSIICSSSGLNANGMSSNNHNSGTMGSTSAAQVKNRLVSVSLFTGEVLSMKTDKDSSSDSIVALRISPSKRLLLVIQKSKPLELWNLQDFEIICYIPYPQSSIKALNWCHSSDGIYEKLGDRNSEVFYICSSSTQPGDNVSYYMVDDQTKEVTRFRDIRYPIAFHMVEKNKFRVSSDQHGNLVVWNRKRESDVQNSPYQLTSHKGAVTRINFAPRGPYVSVLYADGLIEVWDLDSNKRLCKSPTRLEFVTCDWTSNNLLVCARTNGSVLVFDIIMKKCFDPMMKRTLQEPTCTPLLLPLKETEAMRTLLEHDRLEYTSTETSASENVIRNGYGELIQMEDPTQLEEKEEQDEWNRTINMHSALIPDSIRDELSSANSLCERLVVVAKYFSDDDAIRFWRLAQVHLEKLKDSKVTERLMKHVADITMHTESDDYKEKQKPLFEKKLPSIFDVFRDRESVQHDEQARLNAHDSTVRHLNEKGADLFSQVAQDQAQFGHKDDAVKLLLQTPLNHQDMYVNFFHACVCAAANSPEHFRHTVLYVTSSLMARRNEPQNTDSSKDLAYATELLCLIGETHRACRFLQNSDEWEKAAHLAQTTCSEDERYDILIRWANHLSASDGKLKACLLWLNMGYLYNVLDLLHQMRMHSVAVSLLRVIEEEDIPIIRCKRRGVGILSEKAMDIEQQENSKNEENSDNLDEEQLEAHLLNQLKCRIYWCYAHFLKTCHLPDIAKEYEEKIEPSDVGLDKNELR